MLDRLWGARKSQVAAVDNMSATNTTPAANNASTPEQKLYSTDGETGLMTMSDPKNAEVEYAPKL